MREYVKGANPYLPLWEHIPDGEPRLFEYNGEKRVYVYGSHDTLITGYCGDDQVVWSAPADDLTNWRYEGVCYKATDNSILYAPDVVQKGDTFYLYAAEQCGNRVMVAKSKNPAGPFTDPVETKLGFDPGVLVDDDGRVYAYWGFCSSFCAELEEDMATIKPGTLVEHPIGHCNAMFEVVDKEHVNYQEAFFEASSPRKINGKYVYIYSKRYDVDVPELGVHEPCNGFLSYVYSDKPLGDFKLGGDISFNGGEIITGKDGNKEMTYRWGNNHGSIIEVNGQWYVFYHRQTGTDEYARQGMIEPIDVAVSKKGEVFIGKVTYDEAGEPIRQQVVEMTSQGVHVNGMDAYQWIQSGYACFLTGGSKTAYIKPVYEKADTVSAPIVDITDGTTAGYRYLQFGSKAPEKIELELDALKEMTVSVKIDSHDGKEIASAQVQAGSKQVLIPVTEEITGKHAVYITFDSEEEDTIASFAKFAFV